MSLDRWDVTGKSDVSPIGLAVNCLVCGKEVVTDSIYITTGICDKCKAAIMLVRDEIELIEEKEKTCTLCAHDHLPSAEYPCINCINNARDHFEQKGE